MTKTQYREYLGSAEWQQRRKAFLIAHDKCAKCSMPRWLAAIAYDQDLHVHHLSYSSVGSEPDSDLQPLCRRCHDVETFGRSDLSAPKSAKCKFCFEQHFDPYADICQRCEVAVVPEYAEECAQNINWYADSVTEGYVEPLWKATFRSVIGEKVRADAEAKGDWSATGLSASLRSSLEPFLQLLTEEEASFTESIRKYPAMTDEVA